ncbi:ABC transporter ATP-binding protein [Paracidobacterium acidisoli]|uniref:ABC transporter ATP-binding protein n=1 Tax=Paracidobacterium acidisoli TaxID=2303751 RepID=A0A372IPN8_9BACT|nr:ABC transporter ATP-binding protein [Paracidobacterium acidisoli]MBT9331255.1 ABC transporter ATP-binding protein [Paracidobacterium acidisoli]
MTTLLEFADVSFGYTAEPILEAVNATVSAGECIALIGPNGAGKTTLLRLAAGMLTPASGEVRFQGAPLRRRSRQHIARSIALVPQNLDVPFAFTVEQIVEQGRTPFIRALGGLQRTDREAIENALELTDTGYLRARIFNQLSGGERQRVKIALGLAQQPRLLLLDEPAQQLDIARQMEMMQLIRSLRSQGITLLASMHDLFLIDDTFSSVCSISPGEPLQQGPVDEMLCPESLERIFHCPPGSLPRKEICLA